MPDGKNPGAVWPSHGRSGRHDWWTYLERMYAGPFQDALRDAPEIVDSAVDDNGRTMLMYALGSSLEIVEILLKAGADVNRRDSSGRAVWDFAPTWGPSSVEKWGALVQAGLDVDSRGTKDETPLVGVCSGYVSPATDLSLLRSRSGIVRLLLDAGAAIDAVDRYGCSPLRAAAAAGNGEAVELLLKAGADPNQMGSGTRSALFEASVHGYDKIVRALLRGGARPEAATLGSRSWRLSGSLTDVEGVTPLIAAADGGHFQTVRLLVEAGADVNRGDSSGFTPLMGAACTGHPRMAGFLLQRGARRDALDASGRDALTHAVESGHQRELAPILRRPRREDASG
ncbi:hypothetical protein EPO15_03795 [bacterium]|nr:MAG: hypothetical protein EPO15_03795 [bacterium]